MAKHTTLRSNGSLIKYTSDFQGWN